MSSDANDPNATPNQTSFFYSDLLPLFITIALMGSLVLLILLPPFWTAFKSRAVTACATNLKQIGAALRVYADESPDGLYPPMKAYDCAGDVVRWSQALDVSKLYPHYLTDLELLVCPNSIGGDTALELWDEGKTPNPKWKKIEGFSNNGTVEPCEILGEPYHYYGWAIQGDYGGNHEYYRALRSLIMQIGTATDSQYTDTLRKDLDTTTEPIFEGYTLFRLGNDTGWKINADIFEPGYGVSAGVINRTLEVMHDTFSRDDDHTPHRPYGLNVLYMDGHVEFLKWNGYKKNATPENVDRTYTDYPANEAGFMLHEIGHMNFEVETPESAGAPD